MTATPVLVVGAGPTGLSAACALWDLGVPCRVVDRRPGPGIAPKGLVLWSGALECLDRLGVAEKLTGTALPLAGASYWSKGRKLAGVRFGGLTGTAFPGPLCVPQPVTERALLERLTELGGTVEWETEATAVTVHRGGPEESVTVTLSAGGAEETVTVPWLVAADGARSLVRDSVGIPFEGHTFDRTFLIGDGRLEGAPEEAEVQHHITPDGVLVIVPQPDGHRVFFDTEPDERTDPPSEELLQRLLDERGPGGLRLHGTWWTSRFRVHAKVAPRFREGPVLLAGDAVHAHTTAGGQGLNTGVQDGYDVGWKLATVVRGGDPALLDSYEAERRPASVRAVANGDQQIRMWLLRRPVARLLRNTVMRALSATGLLERKAIPLLAQLDLDHSGSPAVAASDAVSGVPRTLRPGRRSPDATLIPVTGTAATTLHDHLAAGRHTLLVYGAGTAGEAAVRAADAVRERGVGDTAQVLWIQPATAEAAQVPQGTGDLIVAREQGRTLGAAGSPWVAYVRPDGVVAARSAPAGLDALLARLPSREPLTAPVPSLRP
ncbi:FAD-dependent monooxygenase [Streptomyces neyagawaensis]|uniref:FAD-dependent monooxygenase n=1 Tax=Streptomyces neyagawaensis TaxID=42238 RepID=UPI0006E3796D|nr:FAD-dependent monooxygenase [Streptomyces neyagawaensis]MCL6732903.1 FAD-dependent monooxygenase [Streptomyces neyagawaensis]MDE1681329.1 FAD-dependent monooxygenase [Streptomyces neyagawaensis]